MINYIKKNFEKPENRLMQIIIIHGLVFFTLLIIHIANKLMGMADFEKVSGYLYLMSDHLRNRPWTLFTYAFVYGPSEVWYFLVHMYGLHVFGRIVVYLLGNRKFVMLYFLGAIAGGITFWSCYQLLPYFIKIKTQALTNGTIVKLAGSSAALYAVIAGIATFAPNFALPIFPLFSVKIKYITFILLLFPLLSLFVQEGEEALHIARLGGALWGYAYINYLFFPPQKAWKNWVKKTYVQLKKYPAKLFFNVDKKPLEASEEASEKENQKLSKKELHLILDKIALKGY
ncbi:MAG: rhomboid family intramembrane serine protease, partial [Bacteroidota bacterium]